MTTAEMSVPPASQVTPRDDAQRVHSRTFRRAAAGAAAFLGLFVLWLALDIGGHYATHVFNDVSGTVTALAAALMCALAARTQTGRPRRAWFLFALATLAWGLGETAWTVYELILNREVPFPSIADVGYLTFVPLAVAAMLTVPSAPNQISLRIRTLLDGLIATGSMLFVSWALVLEPIYRDTTQGLLSKAIGLAYPLGDIAIAAIALAMIARAPRGGRSALALLTAGLLVLAAADSFFAYLSVTYEYETGGMLDALWVAAFLLIGLAGLRRMQCPASPPRPASRTSFARSLIPPVSLVPVLVLAIGRLVQGRPLGAFLSGTADSLVVLLAARQTLTIHENVTLARDLERQVDDRTRHLRASEELSRGILQTANDAFISVDAHGHVVGWNDRAEVLFGWTADEATGRSVATLVGPTVRLLYEARRVESAAARGGDHGVETQARDRSGRSFPVEVTAWAMHTTDGMRINAFIRDISERKAFEERLLHQSLHDDLTGLPNRALFEDRVRHALTRAAREGEWPAVLFVDLDDFKTLNDSLGHHTGDDVLLGVAERLRTTVRPGDTVARFGADQFAVLLENPPVTKEAARVADRLTDAVRRPLTVAGRQVVLRCSIGIAAASEDVTSAMLISNAGTALYFAKMRGDTVTTFSPEMHTAMVARLDLEADLRAAWERRELSIAYQPIVAIDTLRVVGVEALLRWDHPLRGPISPAEFVPIAEATGLIMPIGAWVLERACRQATRWHTLTGAELRLNVNLSTRQLDDDGLVSRVRAILGRTEFPTRSLVLEVTESVVTNDSDALIRTLGELRSLGIRIAMDDFGTGYSSLGYLRRLPIDALKIDKSFVDGAASSGEDAALIRGIVHIARTLGLDVTAEGVETDDQLAVLRAEGCGYGQGYLFAKPLTADDVTAMLLLSEDRRTDRLPA